MLPSFGRRELTIDHRPIAIAVTAREEPHVYDRKLLSGMHLVRNAVQRSNALPPLLNRYTRESIRQNTTLG